MKNLQLQLEAEKYISDKDAFFYKDGISDSEIKQLAKIDFIAGATSNAAKEYWKKQLEKEKLKFAIEQIRPLENICWEATLIVEELEQKLNELNV